MSNQCLIDSGATNNFVSSAFARQARLSLSPASSRVQFPNETTAQITECASDELILVHGHELCAQLAALFDDEEDVDVLHEQHSDDPAEDVKLRALARAMMKRHPEVFRDPPPGLPPKRKYEHTIQLKPDSTPPNIAPPRMSATQRIELERIISDMLRRGQIQPSISPYGAPALLVRKKDGSWRLVVDYRCLNDQTVRDVHPLPDMRHLTRCTGGSTIRSLLDLKSGFHQVRVAEQDRAKTAFRTPSGLYQFTVMPMGTTTSPAVFQRIMQDIFSDLIDAGCVQILSLIHI